MTYTPRDPNILKAVDLIKDGKSVKQVCDATGCEPDAVKYAMKKLGIKSTAKTPSRVPDDVAVQIKRLAKAGVEVANIAERFGLSYSTAARYASDV